MIKEICICGAPKEHHLIDSDSMVGAKIGSHTMNIFIEIARFQLAKYGCECLNYKQDNLNFLEAEVERRETC